MQQAQGAAPGWPVGQLLSNHDLPFSVTLGPEGRDECGVGNQLES